MDEMEYKNAVQALLSQIGKVEWNGRILDASTNARADAVICLEYGNSKKKLWLEFKSTGEPRAIAEFIGHLKGGTRGEYYPVLVAPFISDRGRELCETSDIGCIDLSGNAFLKFDTVYIDRWGNDNRYTLDRKQKNLFSTKSSWVIRSMLSAPEKEWTVQELSRCSSVSMGQVHKVLDGLESENYVLKRRGSTKLSDPSGLLDLWTKNYRYDDQKVLGYHSLLKSYGQITTRLKQMPGPYYALTLGAAAQLISPVVRSSDVHMYVRNVDLVIDALDLEPVEFGGNIHLMEPIDDGVLRSVRTIDGVNLVSDLQLYLDLYNYPQRGREQAEAIRDKVLRF